VLNALRHQWNPHSVWVALGHDVALLCRTQGATERTQPTRGVRCANPRQKNLPRPGRHVRGNGPWRRSQPVPRPRGPAGGPAHTRPPWSGPAGGRGARGRGAMAAPRRAAGRLRPPDRGSPAGAASARQRRSPHGRASRRSRQGNGGEHAVAERVWPTLPIAGRELEECDTPAQAPPAVVAYLAVCSPRQRCPSAHGYLAPLGSEQT
jgi:hypothetical protein